VTRLRLRPTLLGALALLASGAASPALAGEERPNVLLVVIDTLRADHLGAWGYERPTSPRIDALAASGVRFSEARSTSSWTAPSVASILTGLYPVHHGLQLPTSRLRPNTMQLQQTFANAGYVTAALSANAAFVSVRQGFDRGFSDFRMVHGGPSRDPDDIDVMPGGPGGGGNVKVANARIVTDSALQWLASAGTDKPFLLYVHYFDPHGGYFPPPEYAARFGVDKDSPMLTVAQQTVWKQIPPASQVETLEALYDGEIAFTDAEIGRLLDAMPKDRPLLVVLTADHGEEFLEHGGLSHARTLFEEQLHVPLVFAGAGVAGGRTIERPVSIADVWPTLAEMTGLQVPLGLDGISLAPTLRGGGEPPARTIFADMMKAKPQQDMIHRHAVIDGSWKLLEGMDDGLDLYDLDEDPREKEDVADDEAGRAAALRSLLTQHNPRRAARRAEAPRPAPTVKLSEQDRERMRALGYDPD